MVPTRFVWSIDTTSREIATKNHWHLDWCSDELINCNGV